MELTAAEGIDALGVLPEARGAGGAAGGCVELARELFLTGSDGSADGCSRESRSAQLDSTRAFVARLPLFPLPEDPLVVLSMAGMNGLDGLGRARGPEPDDPADAPVLCADKRCASSIGPGDDLRRGTTMSFSSVCLRLGDSPRLPSCVRLLGRVGDDSATDNVGFALNQPYSYLRRINFSSSLSRSPNSLVLAGGG